MAISEVKLIDFNEPMKTEMISSNSQKISRAFAASGVQSSPSAQQGVVLIVCLVLLALVTILGLSTMSGSGLELKMSSGFRDRAVAFEVAEETLRVAETWLDETNLQDDNYYATCTGSDCFTSDCTNGLCVFYDPADPFETGIARVDCGAKLDPPDNPVWKWTAASGESDVWADNSGKHEVHTAAQPGVDFESRYIIEFMCYVDRVDGTPCTSGNESACAPQFRVTALARGPSNSSAVILQSMYKKVN